MTNTIFAKDLILDSSRFLLCFNQYSIFILLFNNSQINLELFNRSEADSICNDNFHFTSIDIEPTIKTQCSAQTKFPNEIKQLLIKQLL